MSDAFGISTDVITASSAIAGLLLVYLGAVAASFSTFEVVSQGDVQAIYRRRAWVGFSGIAFCLSATACGLFAKEFLSEIFQFFGLAFLFIGLLSAAATALWTVLDIK